MLADVKSALDRLPRVALATLPTPLQELRRLRDVLGGPGRSPRILVKRDDLTGLAGGGNKARKLEFLVADALRDGATVLVTTGGAQSNHARMTAAAGRMVGLAHEPGPDRRGGCPEVQGNLLLDHLFGAEVHFIRAGDDPHDGHRTGRGGEGRRDRRRASRPRRAPVRDPDRRLQSRGGAWLRRGDGRARGAAGGRASNVPRACTWPPDRAGTAAGLVLGAQMADAPYRVHGVAVSGGDPAKSAARSGARQPAAALTAARSGLTAGDFETDQSQIGPGYGRDTPACLEAISLVARTEGILLDPVYTGKAMAGLLADIRAGAIAPSESVVFLHTGGLPGIFGHAAALAASVGVSEVPRLTTPAISRSRVRTGRPPERWRDDPAAR